MSSNAPLLSIRSLDQTTILTRQLKIFFWNQQLNTVFVFSFRSLPPLPPPSTVTVAAPTPPETPLGSAGSDGAPASPQFVYVTTAVSTGPLTPPASEYSSDAENTPTDATGPNNAVAVVATATATTTVYGLIDYVIERGSTAYDPLISKDLNANNNRKTTTERFRSTTSTTTTTTQVQLVTCNSGNKGNYYQYCKK